MLHSEYFVKNVTEVVVMMYTRHRRTVEKVRRGDGADTEGARCTDDASRRRYGRQAGRQS